MINKKFELVEQEDTYLYRVKALRDGSWGFEGTLGGFVEKESNLSQEGDCWIYGNAKVFDDATVSDNALVSDNAHIGDDSYVCGNSSVYGNACVCGNSNVSGNSSVYGNARLSGEAHVGGNFRVHGKARVFANLKCHSYYINGSVHIVNYVGHRDGKPMIMIGCEERSLGHWLENYKEIGAKYKYSEAQIVEYGRHLEHMKRLLEEV